jgi:hypothetical protein
VEPGSAKRHYRWYRDSAPIAGATSPTYDVTAADLGHRIHVVVSMDADHWVSRSKRSPATDAVRTKPQLHAHTSMRSGRVFLRLDVTSPGVSSPHGAVRVLRGSVVLGRFHVTDGHGSKLLAHMRHGTRQLTIVYHGGPLESVGRKTVTVTVP